MWVVYVAVPFLLLAAAYLIARARQEWSEHGRLSSQTAAGVWALIILHAAGTTYAAWHGLWLLPIDRAVAFTLTTACFVVSVWFYVGGVLAFRSSAQISGVETGGLVTGGVYRWSRNPQDLGWGLMLCGLAVAGRSLAGVLLAYLFFLIIHAGVRAEEEHLERVFGAEYRRYRSTVPRYLKLI